MRRHQIFAYPLVCLTLFPIQLLRADERPRSDQRETAKTVDQYDQFSGGNLPYKPVPNASETILKRWSAASRFLSPVTPQSKVEEFKKENQTYFTGHELALISEFQQPVTAQTLLDDYEWHVVRQSKANIILRGQPKDVLTRHLCRPFELSIDPQSMLPESLTFLSDPTSQKQGFGSIELTALKVSATNVAMHSNDAPHFVSRKVMKAIFPQNKTPEQPASATSPIKRVSFSKSSSESKNEAELQEIEKLVSRWIMESQRIDSILLANGVTILGPGDNRQVTIPAKGYTKADGTRVGGWLGFQGSLRPWLIKVDQKSFLIESFTIELATDESGPLATRFTTLKLKPNPDASSQTNPAERWDTVEIEFSSRQPLPVKITKTRLNFVQQFLLSDIKVKYAE
ncbi:hypothetical protein Pan241w_02840 [Gimesia alba]|uniref:Uncharacterized protein n=2 Tax=Gimesia alba TaxID=2527973 RepID=A0A517R8N5_9PLAN|nr:hypothetical protein Pan241w_02840 [Gimesia alba]